MQDKRDFLFDLLPKNAVCAEIGVWKGEFSQKILEHLNPKELYLIDPWLYIPSYNESWYGGAEAKSQEDMDKIYYDVTEKFKNNSRVHILRTYSIKAANLFQKELDFVYIDSCHLYEYVKQDLMIWYKKIKNGGFLVGDDYNAPNTWWKDGVTRAVNEFVEINKLILSVKKNQFIIEKGR